MASSPEFWSSSRPEIETATADCRIGNSAAVKVQRAVVLEKYSVEELKLIGLVTRTREPCAMLVDPTGKGTVVTRGQYLGRAEIVRAGGPGGAEYELNWRVDRIREGDIVLVREDPAHPDVQVATKVISLPRDVAAGAPGESAQ